MALDIQIIGEFMFKLVWVVAALTVNGPSTGNIKDPTEHKSEKECVAYGESHTDRMKDWIRGRLSVHFDYEEVAVTFDCKPDGAPT